MESSSAPDSKRRRTSYTIQTITSITKLPHDYLSAIADYLPQISRGLLAVALPAPSASLHTTTGSWNCERELSDAGKAVISIKTPSAYTIISLDKSSVEGKKRMEAIQKARWEILDFSDIGDLAGKLSDDDISALLVSIKAKKKLRVLDIDCCHKIIGHGLEPLRGSTVLERIYIDEEGGMCITTVIPIFESIIDSTENPRMDLVQNIISQLADEYRSPVLVDFFVKLEQLILNEEKSCDACEENGDNEHIPCEVACFSCSRRLCDYCNCDSDERILRCNNCNFTACASCEDFAKCYTCESTFCSSCASSADVDAAIPCRHDGYSSRETECSECKNRHNNSCGYCEDLHERAAKSKKIIKKLVFKSNMMQEENVKVVKENKKMKEENDQLRKDMEELKMKLARVEMSE